MKKANIKSRELKVSDSKFNFQGTDLTVITDIEKNTQLFPAIEVAEALGYSETANLTKSIKEKYKTKLNTAKFADLRKGSVLLTEAGVYQACMLATLDSAEAFQDFVFEEVLPSIRKHGFYIKEPSTDEEAIKIVEGLESALKTRRLIDTNRNLLLLKITQFLQPLGYTQKQLSSLFARVYQNLHVATTKLSSTGILLEVINTTSDLQIVTYNQLRDKDRVYSQDYKVALNFYSEEKLAKFNDYFVSILKYVINHIESDLVKATTSSVVEILERISKQIIVDMTDLEIGSKIAVPSRPIINNVIKQIREGSVTYEEAREIVADIKSRELKV